MKSHKFSKYSFNYPEYNIVLFNIVAFHEHSSNGNSGTVIICNEGREFLVGESVYEVRDILGELEDD